MKTFPLIMQIVAHYAIIFTSGLQLTSHTNDFQTFILGQTGFPCQRGTLMCSGMFAKTSAKTSTSLQTSSRLLEDDAVFMPPKLL